MKKSKSSNRTSRDSQNDETHYKLTKLEREKLDDLLDRLGVGEHWDIVIIGDGSGSNWSREAGWGSVSIERATGERLVWAGGMSRGTVNFAEMMAYLQPLNWLQAREAEVREAHDGRRRAFRVHIITDSEYCSKVGNTTNRLLHRNGLVWSAFDALARFGFILKWHWIRRESCGLNIYTDKLSKLSRKLVKTYKLQEAADRIDGVSVYRVNPGPPGRDKET